MFGGSVFDLFVRFGQFGGYWSSDRSVTDSTVYFVKRYDVGR